MCALHPPCMLDRAPVLLGTCSNLTSISNNTIAVRAISTIKSFNQIQIGELVAIKDQIVTPSDFNYPVHRKTDELIQRKQQIKQ